MLRFELAGTPGNFISIDPAKVGVITENSWPLPQKSLPSGDGNRQQLLVATIWTGQNGNWTVLDPNRVVAAQIAAAKKGNALT